MRKLLFAAGAITLVLGTLVAGAAAQAPGGPTGSAAVRDPQTLAALDRMGTALRNLKSFEVSVDTTEERVLTTGQKIQYGGSALVKGELPSRLRIDRVSDRQARNLYFDGSTLTIYSPRVGFYGSVPATGTIRQAAAAVAENYGIETPLADLFAWGEDPSAAAKVTSAFYVGAETVNGVACDQYALRQANVDWQVWIRQKGTALPCKLVITSTDDPSMPQSSAIYSWTLQKVHPADSFTFVPPKDSRKISLVKASPTAAPE